MCNSSVKMGVTTTLVVDGIPAGFGPSGLVFNADNTKLYVGSYAKFDVGVINVTANTYKLIAGSPGTPAWVDGVGTSARFDWVQGLALVKNESVLYVADMGIHRIRKIVLAGGTVSTVAGSGVSSSIDGVGTQVSTASKISFWGLVGR